MFGKMELVGDDDPDGRPNDVRLHFLPNEVASVKKTSDSAKDRDNVSAKVVFMVKCGYR
jgi:hypothetical protein